MFLSVVHTCLVFWERLASTNSWSTPKFESDFMFERPHRQHDALNTDTHMYTDRLVCCHIPSSPLSVCKSCLMVWVAWLISDELSSKRDRFLATGEAKEAEVNNIYQQKRPAAWNDYHTQVFGRLCFVFCVRLHFVKRSNFVVVSNMPYFMSAVAMKAATTTDLRQKMCWMILVPIIGLAFYLPCWSAQLLGWTQTS